MFLIICNPTCKLLLTISIFYTYLKHCGYLSANNFLIYSIVHLFWNFSTLEPPPYILLKVKPWPWIWSIFIKPWLPWLPIYERGFILDKSAMFEGFLLWTETLLFYYFDIVTGMNIFLLSPSTPTTFTSYFWSLLSDYLTWLY